MSLQTGSAIHERRYLRLDLALTRSVLANELLDGLREGHETPNVSRVQLRAAATSLRQSGTAAADYRTTRFAAAVTPCELKMQQALQRRASERPLVSCYAELDGTR